MRKDIQASFSNDKETLDLCRKHPNAMNELKYKMEVAYDGTHYSGWQVQPNSTSIQTLLQNALGVALRKPVMIAGSGRTDAGVHALAQVAHFTVSEEVDTYRLLLSLNALLPHDIRIKSLTKVSDDFHSRYSAIGKIYHYHVHLDRLMSPFKRLYYHQVFDKIDLDLMKKAAVFFLLTHDFTFFTNEAHKKSAAINAVKTIKRLYIIARNLAACDLSLKLSVFSIKWYKAS